MFFFSFFLKTFFLPAVCCCFAINQSSIVRFRLSVVGLGSPRTSMADFQQTDYRQLTTDVLFLACDLLLGHRRATRPLPGPRIGMGALASNRQPAPVAQPPVAPDIHQALDIELDLFSQIALDAALLIHNRADPIQLVL